MTKKELRLSLLFFAILAVLLYAINYLVILGVRQAAANQTGKISQLMSHKLDPDIIIFGASNGETGIDPKILAKGLNLSVFNMCIDGTGVVQFGDLMKEFNLYSKNGKYAILALAPALMTHADLPSSPDRYYAWLDNKYIGNNSLLNKLPEVLRCKNFSPYGFTLYGPSFYKSSIDGWRRYFGSNSIAGSCYDQLGWVPMNVKWGQSNTLSKLDSMLLETDDVAFSTYREIIGQYNSKGRKIIVVLMPSQQDARAYYKGYDQLVEKLKLLAGTNNLFLDYSDHPISYDKNYFYNYTHLNIDGAKIFSEQLSVDIVKHIDDSLERDMATSH